jgi:DNA-binding NarL/FixJ family response regulator
MLEPRFSVVARAGNGRDLLDIVAHFAPSVAIVDVTMPVMNGIEATAEIRKRFPNTKVVILSGHSDPDFVQAAFSAGASGYVVKVHAYSELIPAIQKVLAGQLHRPAPSTPLPAKVRGAAR